eukprot:TRINITY_DN23789_c0_g1_i1.p1 TRINITY_DN23789_c0_g1~~TRINITY_DN23789_c0_g1_i1.p1  ORF type:complete len:795 (+),score=100.36 TRINITY_DN23789_c0_g1_i1:97-2481(+)
MGVSSSTRHSRRHPDNGVIASLNDGSEAGDRKGSSANAPAERPKTKHSYTMHAVSASEHADEHVQPLIVRNLDTGEVRNLLHEELDEEFFGARQDPDCLVGSSSLPWSVWWQEHRKKFARLLEVAQKGDVSSLRQLLQHPKGRDGLIEDPLDPFASGALEGTSACFSPPSSAWLNPNARALHGRTALHVAADRGHAECVELLLDLGVSIDAQTDSGFTPLHLASERGHLEVLCTLLAARCNAGLQADQGELAVHLAAAKGQQEALEFLVDHCPPDLLNVRNSYGQRPWEVCLDAGTARLFQGSFSVIRSRVESSSSTATPRTSSSFAVMSDVDAADADFYAGRTLFENGSVLLRNSRSDAVQRLLLGSGKEPGSTAELEDISISARRIETSRRRRQRFMTLRDMEHSGIEVVGPQSFRLMSVLGRGSFGEVFQVAHKVTSRVYAMKVLRKNKIISRNLTRYAVTERNLLSYIRHPYIVRLHYAFQTSNCLVLVLQYCSGGNLSDLLKREGSLPEVVVRLYMAEVLLALEHLHARQVVYRDLKPENVVIDDESHALLTDFGLSKEGVEGLQGTRSFCGSVAYLAPEILARSGHGKAVDLYGLGVLLFEMLSGQPPFYSRDRDTLFRNITSAKLLAPARANQKSAHLIFELMHRDPANRLGANDTSEVRDHPFFAVIDFEKILKREVTIPPLRRQSAHVGRLTSKDDKIVNPFEGRLGAQVFKSWSSRTQDVDGWEFSGADPLPSTPPAPARGASSTAIEVSGSQSRREGRRPTSRRSRARTAEISAGLLRPMLAF